MDPVSFAASIITLIATTQVCIQYIVKLRALQQAPEQLSSLVNELSDLVVVLSQVATLEQQYPKDERSAGSLFALNSQIKRARSQLDELCELIKRNLTKQNKNGGVTIAWRAWSREKNRIIELQTEICNSRFNLLTVIGVMTVSSITRVELQIQQISTREGLRLPLPTVLGPLLVKPSQQQPRKQPELSPLSSTGHNLPIPDAAQDRSLISVTPMPRLLNRSCKAWCNCACHSTRAFRTPSPFRSIIGSLFIGSAGLPVLSLPCDEETCRQHSTTSISFTYLFPTWFLFRMISARFAVTSFLGPQFSLKMPRMIPWNSPLWVAAREGDQSQIEMLFASRLASPYDVNAYGQSALHSTVRFKKIGLSKFLIDQGAELDLHDENGRKPIDTAWELILSRSMSVEETEMMTQVFDDREYLTTRGFTNLHKCVNGLLPRSLEIELSISSHLINQVDSYGRTCLAWAAARKDHSAMQLLLSYGADPRIPDFEGNTSLAHAIKANDIDGTRMLIQFEADATKLDVEGRTTIHLACLDHDNPELIALLVSVGVNIDALDFDGDPALNYAIWGHFHNSIAKLLELGADPNIVNTGGDSVLNMAIYYRATDVVEMLLERNANLENVNTRNETILHAISGTPHGPIIRLMTQQDLSQINADMLTVDNKSYGDCFKEGADSSDIQLLDAFVELNRYLRQSNRESGNFPASNMTPETNGRGNSPNIAASLYSLEDEGSVEHFEDALEG